MLNIKQSSQIILEEHHGNLLELRNNIDNTLTVRMYGISDSEVEMTFSQDEKQLIIDFINGGN